TLWQDYHRHAICRLCFSAAQRHQKRKSLSVADSSPHGRIVQTRSTTGYDREAEQPEMWEAPDLTPLSSTCAPWRPCVAFQQFLSGVFPAGVRRSPGRAQPLMTGVLSRAIDGPLVRLLSDHTL